MRAVSSILSYLMVFVTLLVVGVSISLFISNSLLPLSVQESYHGGVLQYQYEIQTNKTIIRVFNPSTHDVKADIMLVNKDKRVLTSCAGLAESSLGIVREASGALQLLGVVVKSNEIVTITCFESGISDVKVLEYGVSLREGGEAYVGNMPGGYNPGDPKFGLRLPQAARLYFRIPITVVSTSSYSSAFVVVTLSPDTLPSDIYGFVRTHMRLDMNDVLVVGVDGKEYPTSGKRYSDKIEITFKVTDLQAGVNYFFFYFGNPYQHSPVKPLSEVPSGTVIRTSLPNTITSLTAPLVYPAFMIPETNWLPKSDNLKFGLIHVTSKSQLDWYASVVRSGDYESVKQVLNIALGNKVFFPVGTNSSNPDYLSLKPKTVFGNAPWGSIAVAPLPALLKDYIPSETSIYTRVWVSSDDGSMAYLLSLKPQGVTRLEYYDKLQNYQGPSYWNYAYVSGVNPEYLDGADNYLVIVQQNGIYQGSGPGWLDFRYVMQWIEKTSLDAPTSDEFLKPFRGYLDVTATGVGVSLVNYALPVNLTGRNDIDWSAFSAGSVYVLDSEGNPLHYWVQEKGTNVIVWVRIPSLSPRGTYKFRIYYGGLNQFPQYSAPEYVFLFYDDFRLNPVTSNKWNIYSFSLTFASVPIWSSDGYLTLIGDGTYLTGVQIYMKGVDLRTNFHAQFKARISGDADGMAFFFFFNDNPTTLPAYGASLGLYYFDPSQGNVNIPGYSVVFDIYRNPGEPNTPYVGLAETFTWKQGSLPNVVMSKRVNYKDAWVYVDVYFVNNNLKVYMNGSLLFSYTGGVFSQYGIQGGKFGFSAGVGGSTGTFSVDDVLLRYFPGSEPRLTIIGYLP